MDKSDGRDKRQQHTLYLQIVLMKQPGPAPQYRMQEKFLFSAFCPLKANILIKHMANDRGVNIKVTADWFFQNRQRTEVSGLLSRRSWGGMRDEP